MVDVVICEKPKQAQAVRAAIGAKYGKVMTARGHILRLEEPHEINPAWKSWGYDLLEPQNGATFFNVVPSESTKAMFDDLRAAIEGASNVVIATDCDREGEMIGREIVDAVPGFSGTIQRAIYTAVDPKSIQTAFENLRPASDFDRLYDAARARATLDQMQNLSLTRAVTVGYSPPGWKGALGIGRVKTPLMGLICRREDEITNFKERAFYDIRLDASLRDGAAAVALWWRASGEDRLWDKARADAIASAAGNWSGTLKVTKDRKKQGPPRLPHLTELQKRAGKWGWSPDKTLEIAQALYDDHKLTTYPRSECRYLPETQIENAPKMLAALASIEGFAKVAPKEATIRKGKSGHYSTAEVEKLSHDAIVPNANMASEFATLYPKLSPDEKNLFDLIARLWMAAVSPDAQFDETVIVTAEPVTSQGQEYSFRAKGKVEVDSGWRVVFSDKDEDDEDEASDEGLPEVADGESAKASGCEPVERKTQVPKRFSLAELPEVMENVWKFVEDAALRERLKETKGIGTSATRGSIITGLIEQGLIIETKKKVHPTEMGMEMYRLVVKIAPSLVDPGETGKMEAALNAILDKKVEASAVIGAGRKRTAALIAALKAGAGTHALKVRRAPTPKMVTAVRMIAKANGMKVPPEAVKDFDACAAFLKEHGRGSGPTEPMKLAAQKIAETKKIELPEDALTDFAACKAFLDAHPMEKKPPSEAQLGFAAKLAEEGKVKIPDDAKEDSRAMSKWIDARVAKARKKPAAKSRAKAKVRS